MASWKDNVGQPKPGHFYRSSEISRADLTERRGRPYKHEASIAHDGVVSPEELKTRAMPQQGSNDAKSLAK